VIDCWNTSQVFKAGHRIGLEISSSAFPKYDRNLNTGVTGHPDAPLIFDEEYRPKPAYFALVDVLKEAPNEKVLIRLHLASLANSVINDYSHRILVSFYLDKELKIL
jgi:X-Pro dipeptidyl-peptidase-like protein